MINARLAYGTPLNGDLAEAAPEQLSLDEPAGCMRGDDVDLLDQRRLAPTAHQQ